MVEVKATADVERNGTNVSATYSGQGIVILEESIAIVEALYNDSIKHGVGEIFLGMLGGMVCDWVDEFNHKVGEHLA